MTAEETKQLEDMKKKLAAKRSEREEKERIFESMQSLVTMKKQLEETKA